MGFAELFSLWHGAVLFTNTLLPAFPPAEIMNAAMAAPEEPGLQPQPMSNWSSFFFFAAFVLVVGYTLLNLYIGVVFYQFSRIRMQSQTGSAFLTDDQTEWVEMSKLVFRLKPPEKSPVPVNKLRRYVLWVDGRLGWVSRGAEQLDQDIVVRLHVCTLKLSCGSCEPHVAPLQVPRPLNVTELLRAGQASCPPISLTRLAAVL